MRAFKGEKKTCKIVVLQSGMYSSVNFENPLVILNFKAYIGNLVSDIQPYIRQTGFVKSILRSQKGIL